MLRAIEAKAIAIMSDGPRPGFTSSPSAITRVPIGRIVHRRALIPALFQLLLELVGMEDLNSCVLLIHL